MLRSPRSLSLSALLIGSLAFANASAASDGVYEINQTCALQTGCFPGDSAGFPVTINSSGAYRLTSNLRTSSTLTSAVQVAVRDVDLDLNAFVISCSVFTPPFSFNACSDSPSTGRGGVEADVATTGVRVRNGVVRNMAAYGIWLRGTGSVEDVTADANGATGIRLSGGDVKDCTATENGGDGIFIANGRVSGSTASGNSDYGINGIISVSVQDNVALQNGSAGISASRGLVMRNVASYNGTHGIIGSSLAQSNVTIGNSSCGIYLGVTSGYRENVSNENSTNVCGGTNLGSNLCDGGSCP